MTHSHTCKENLLSTTAVLLALTCAPAAYALPDGGAVAAGSATISAVANNMTIDQASTKAVINWNNFNIANGESVRFNQPGNQAIALNRVSATSGQSTIDGILSANGQVWVVNPNGVLFGSNARVDVGGLLASTADISDANFLAPGTDSSGRSVYSFDVAGNGSIIVRNGAQITAAYPVQAVFEDKVDQTPIVLTPELIDQLINDPSLLAQYINGSLALDNWTLTSGSVDVYNLPLPAGPKFGPNATPPAGYTAFIDMDGSTSQGEGVLETDAIGDLNPGQYIMTARLAGRNRPDANRYKTNSTLSPDSPTDSVILQLIDADTNQVLGFREVTLNPNDPYMDYAFGVNLSEPRNLKLQIAGSTGSSDWQGVLLAAAWLHAQESPYVTFLANAIKHETGGKVQAINGAINYATGSTFTASSVGDRFVNNVTVNSPTTQPVIIDGELKSGIQIQDGAFLYAALTVDGSDAPNGTVTLQSVATQSAFNAGADKDSDGVNDEASTFGPLGQEYAASELVDIENGADIRPSPIGGPGGPGAGAGRLTISATVLPDPSPLLDQNRQVNPTIDSVKFVQVAARDTVDIGFVDRIDNVDPSSALVGGQLSLMSPGGAGTANPQALAALAPAAGGTSPEDLGNLSPSAGGNPAALGAPQGDIACGNEFLDKIDIFQEKPNCETPRDNNI